LRSEILLISLPPIETLTAHALQIKYEPRALCIFVGSLENLECVHRMRTLILDRKVPDTGEYALNPNLVGLNPDFTW
jgi:hypothetical protein